VGYFRSERDEVKSWNMIDDEKQIPKRGVEECQLQDIRKDSITKSSPDYIGHTFLCGQTVAG